MNDRRSSSLNIPRSAIKHAGRSMGSQSEHSKHTKLRGRKSVSFGHLDIYEFDQILGDNPACTDGVPLTLEWIPRDTATVGVDYYEFTRDPRRTRKELALPSGDRQIYLLTRGYHMQELFDAAEKVRKVKKERAASFRTQQRWGKFYKVVQSATHAMKSVVSKPTKHETPEAPPKSEFNATAVVSAEELDGLPTTNEGHETRHIQQHLNLSLATTAA